MHKIISIPPHSFKPILPIGIFFAFIGILYLPLWLKISILSHVESYSFIPIIPLFSAFFVFRNRSSFIIKKSGPTQSALWAIGAATGLYCMAFLPFIASIPVVPATLMALSCIAAIVGGCAFWWGWAAIKHHLFAILFLLFAVPLPQAILDFIIIYLQYGSAEVVNLIFKFSGMIYLRDGLTFHFPAMTIFIAKECSGIRSTMALVIITIAAGQMTLHSPWRKLILAIWIIPVSLIKNGIRIASLSFLANFVDTRFITDSFLHHEGGFIFYGISLIIIFGMLALLRLTEKRPDTIA